jgi:hypothetical protein
MNRNAIATNARCLLGTPAFARAAAAWMSQLAEQVRFGGADPGPGEGDAPS